MAPPLCCTIPYTVDNPNPVPFPSGLVVRGFKRLSLHKRTSTRSPYPSLTAPHTDLERRFPAWLRTPAPLLVPEVQPATHSMASRALYGKIHHHLFELTTINLDVRARESRLVTT